MNEIDKWIEEGCDFERGMQLLDARCRNHYMLSTIRRRKDAGKLRYELGKFASDKQKPRIIRPLGSELSNIETMILQKLQERLKIIRKGQIIRYDDLPGVLQKVYLDACDSYRLLKTFHEKMKVATTDEARAQHRAALLEQVERNRKSWAILDKWGEFGIVPDDKPALEGEGVPTAKEIQNAKAAITRNLKSYAKTTDDKKRAVYFAKLEEAVAIAVKGGVEFEENAPKLRELGLID